MEKHRTWTNALRLERRDKATQPPPKYADIRGALKQASATYYPSLLPPVESEKQEDEDDVDGLGAEQSLLPPPRRPPSKRKQRREQRFLRKRERKAHIRQYGLNAYPADSFLFFNATIYASASSLESPSSWMVLSGGRVHSMGRSLPPVLEFAESARQRNMRGAVVLPGLIDSHCHVYFTGKLMTTVDFRACDSIDSFQTTLRAYRDAHTPPSPCSSSSSPSSPHWYVGNRWEHDRLGRYPCAVDVDAVISDHPVFCWRVCYHVAVVNSAALRIAGITRDTPNPTGGSIDRDEHGVPTGLLRETAASAVVALIIESAATRAAYVRKGVEHFLDMGLTFVQTNDEGCWQTYRQLVDDGALPLRVALTIMHKEMVEDGSAANADQPRPGQQHGPLLSCHRVKLFADGALGGETAALSQPYVHRCAHPPSASSSSSSSDSSHAHPSSASATTDDDAYGILIHSQEAMTAAVRRAHSLGYRLEIHVIGDRAASTVVQALVDAAVPPEARPILTHCQVLSSSLLTAFAERGVVANIQPQFLTTDARWVSDRLPPALLTHAYAWRSLLDAAVHCAGGSDAPIEEPSPWEGLHAAVFRPTKQYAEMRADREGWQRARALGEDALREWYGGCWTEHERLTIAQALTLYTTGGAYCAGMEADLGELRPGCWADFVVVDTDIIRDPHALLFARAEEVWVAAVRKK